MTRTSESIKQLFELIDRADNDLWVSKQPCYWLSEIKELADEIRREEAEDRARDREELTVGPDAGTVRTLRQNGR